MKRNFGNDEEIPRPGYGNPPKHSQFQKGQSANPAGRPKGSTRQNALQKAMQTKLTVVEGGKRQKLPAEEVLYKQLVKRALEGDARARRDLLRLLEKLPQRKDLADTKTSAGQAWGVIFMKDSTELLLALGICVEIDNRVVLSSWAIEAARERQNWAPLSPEQTQLLEDFGEDFKRAA